MTQALQLEKNLDQADYLKLFLQELTLQDPMKPVDNREFMAQMAQFSSLQQQLSSNTLLEKILQSQIVSQSLALLGKRVRIAGTEKEGQVSKIAFDSGSPQLTVILSRDFNQGGSAELLRLGLHEITEVSRGSA